MSQFDPNDYVTMLDKADSPEIVDAVFEKIAVLPAADRQAALDAVENYAVSDWTKSAPKPAEMAQLKMVIEILEQSKDTPQGKMILASLEQEVNATEGQALSQIILNLHKEKGDTAHPVIKTYAAEAAKLTDEEYGSTFGLLKLFVNVTEKLEAEAKPATAPRTNPFRKPTNPTFNP